MTRLLIVDDSNVIRSRIENVYKDDNEIEIVGKAMNGQQAIYYVKNHTPDAVTMDLTMPKLDGVACIEEIMKINRNIKILVISALADKATGIKAISKGARGFLNKPFTDEELQSAMNKVVLSKDRR